MSYMSVVDGKYMMKGGVRDTLFGLIGATKGRSEVKALGGIVDGGSPSAPKPSGLMKKREIQTERSICGKNATEIPGVHMGQVPYPGTYMKGVGKKL
jgi:hypothetical protein